MKILTMKKALTTVVYLMLLVAVSHSAARAEQDTGIKYRTVEVEGRPEGVSVNLSPPMQIATNCRSGIPAANY